MELLFFCLFVCLFCACVCLGFLHEHTNQFSFLKICRHWDETFCMKDSELFILHSQYDGCWWPRWRMDPGHNDHHCFSLSAELSCLLLRNGPRCIVIGYWVQTNAFFCRVALITCMPNSLKMFLMSFCKFTSILIWWCTWLWINAPIVFVPYLLKIYIGDKLCILYAHFLCLGNVNNDKTW